MRLSHPSEIGIFPCRIMENGKAIGKWGFPKIGVPNKINCIVASRDCLPGLSQSWTIQLDPPVKFQCSHQPAPTCTWTTVRTFAERPKGQISIRFRHINPLQILCCRSGRRTPSWENSSTRWRCTRTGGRSNQRSRCWLDHPEPHAGNPPLRPIPAASQVTVGLL